MIIDRYRKDLSRLGVEPSHAEVLKLLPVVHVAWADGKMERIERLRIRRLAQEHFALDDVATEILEGWLTTAPPPQLVADGLAVLTHLAMADDDPSVEMEELPELVASCEWIARSRTGAVDAPWAVGDAEDAAIQDVAAQLGVDVGHTWTRLWRELGDPAPESWWLEGFAGEPVSQPIPLATRGVVR